MVKKDEKDNRFKVILELFEGKKGLRNILNRAVGIVAVIYEKYEYIKS